MSQSSIIAAALLVGFIVFITVKGELSSYAAIVGLGSSTVSPSVAQQATGLTPLPSLSDLGF
jgi:hypothetical protein